MYRKGKFGLFEVILIAILTTGLSYILGYYIGIKKDKYNLDDEKYINKFRENYNYILDNYYGKIDKESLIDNAIAGMVSSLDDDYSLFTYDSETNISDLKLKGEYEGIGITISQNKDGDTYIVNVEKNSSAEENKIELNSIIREIDGEDISEKNINEITNLIKNNKNKKIVLKIEKNSNIREVTLEKKKIVFDSVTSKVFNEENKNIGYIKIDIFALNTSKQFSEEMNLLEKKKIDSLIIDLRNNGGGHLSSTKEIASYFLSDEKVICQIESKNNRTKYYSEGKENKKYPIVLLTNGMSASGSELLTATLKENLNAISIGEKTFGKGTVQEIKELRNDVKYKITTEKWLTPSGICVDGKGIVPTIEVKESTEYQSNPTEDNDLQLQKAIEVLKNKQ